MKKTLFHNFMYLFLCMFIKNKWVFILFSWRKSDYLLFRWGVPCTNLLYTFNPNFSLFWLLLFSKPWSKLYPAYFSNDGLVLTNCNLPLWPLLIFFHIKQINTFNNIVYRILRTTKLFLLLLFVLHLLNKVSQ